jgi:hypothetical protein
MRLFILISVLLSGNLIISQKQYTYVTDSETDGMFDKAYRKYVSEFFLDSPKVSRNLVLDTVSLMRSKYSADVYMASSKNLSFTKLLNKMSEARSYETSLEIEHSRYFGHPEIFKEPEGCIFPDIKNHPVLKRNRMKWSSEIFYQATYGFYSSEPITNSQIILRFKNYHLGENKYNWGELILSRYLSSYHHRMAIERFGNGSFGSRSYYLISREYNREKNKWHYDVYMCHSVIMLKKV